MTYHHGNLRKALLDRAAHVIAEQGIESLSLRALARDLGVSHAAPSRHFADKADLLRALATEGSDMLVTYVLKAADEAGKNPLYRYAAMGKAYIRFSLTFPAYFKTLTHPDVISHSDDALNESTERRQQLITEMAQQAQAAGWLSDETVEDVVMFSIGTVRGVSAMLAENHQDVQSSPAKQDVLIETIVRLIIDPAHPQQRLNPEMRDHKNNNERRLA